MSLRLNCLIEGEYIAFTVIAVCDDEVDDLKNKLKTKCAVSFKDVDARHLELWRPKDAIDTEPDETLIERMRRLGHDLSEFAVKLDSSKTVCSIFPTPPSSDYIHIIVKNPRTGGNGIGGIDKEIREELKSLQPAVEAFLKNPELPIWVPPQHTMPDIHKFIIEFRIPTYPDGKPSLLLHGLDKCDGQKIKEVFDDVTPMCISGLGKTRRIMEALTIFWGFYFVATPDANDVGIRDLQDALGLVARHREWVPDLKQVPAENRATQNEVNNLIASRAFRRVLAAR